MTTNHRDAATRRVFALFTAATMTALVFASQLGLAEHYTSCADLMLAAKRAAPVAQNAPSTPPLPAKS